ncbi:MAG: L-aspartate oxidase [Acidobacteriota bacterium]
MTRLHAHRPRNIGVDDVVAADVIVLGSGVAGLSTALAMAPRSVLVITKGALGRGGSTPWAQGGVAAAVDPHDDASSHANDTIDAGDGLCDPMAVHALTSEARAAIDRLLAIGTEFDRDIDGELALGREGAHAHARILHAGGDATGAEISRALAAAVHATPEIRVFEGLFAHDLVIDNHGHAVGVMGRDARGRTVLAHAGAVVLATGGYGQLFAHTTNPPAVTGDGVALAARAGAVLADLAFVQFHPTALATQRDPLPLLTEALRGAGAVLRDHNGARFMLAEHPLAELAPRDIVARAIWRRQRGGASIVLDATDAVGETFPERFPTVWRAARRAAFDPRHQPLPVTPAAHYVMGGVAVDLAGRTSIPGLWACGEVTATGVHGANRLASNSLLEGLVYGARVAVDIHARDHARGDLPRALDGTVYRHEYPDRANADSAASHRAALRRLMWRHVGLERDAEGLETALERLSTWAPSDQEPDELDSLLTVGRLVTAAAYARRESRGAHVRRDFPRAESAWARRSYWTYDPSASLPLVAAREHGSVTRLRETA